MIATTSNKRYFPYRETREQREKRVRDFENMKCPLHPGAAHRIKECSVFQEQYQNYQRRSDKTEERPKEEKKLEGNFQEAKGALMIYSGVPDARGKRQEKLAHRAIMAAKPATPKYLEWSEYPIQFTWEGQWTSAEIAGHYPLVLQPTIAGITVTKVLIDGGAGLNILFADTLKKMKLDCDGLMTPTIIPFYGIVPGEASIPLGQIILPVTFGTPEKYQTELIKFEVAGFESSYHAILGRPALTKFIAVPHYPYLLLKMPTTQGVLSLRGDLKRAYDCDVQAVKLSQKLQNLKIGKEITTLAEKTNPDDIEVPTAKTAKISSFKPSEEARTKKMDLQTGDPEKTTIISAELHP